MSNSGDLLDPSTIPDAIYAAASSWPNEEAVVDGARRITFAALAQAVAEATARFKLLISPGDRIALWAPNSLDWIVICAAGQAAGGIIVPINTRLKGSEAAFILNKTRTRIVVTVPEFLGNDYPAMLAAQELTSVEKIICLGDDWQRLEMGSNAATICGPDDTADIIFTSGTTGEPKGVIATQAQNIFAADRWATPVGLKAQDRYLLVNPFFHSFGYKAGWLPCLLRGATIVCLSAFDAPLIARTIEEEAITVLAGAPAIFQSLLEVKDFSWTRSLRTAITGAASVPPILITHMRETLCIPNVLTGYGLTEATGVVTMSDAKDSAEIAATTAGRPVPGVEVECVDSSNRPVARGEQGQVRIRGVNVTPGYFENAAASKEAIDDDGWLYTGDVGEFTEDGCLRLTDRLKDMFITGGFNCYPAEIERALSRHPAIAQVAVIGVPDERLGEVGKAFTILRPDSAVTGQEIQAWAKLEMANYKVPRSFEIVSVLPMNPSGKVQKYLLRESTSPSMDRNEEKSL